MKLVMTLAVGDDAELVDAQIAYHANAGVDVVLASVEDPTADTRAILEQYVRAGCLQLRGADSPTQLARLAASDHGADWVISSEPGEFWWPRAESLKETLVAIPPRYTIVQALIRDFLPHAGDEFFAERMTVRRSLQSGTTTGAPAELLKRAHRSDPEVVVEPGGWISGPRDVPLRAWYPFEVFRFPAARAGVDDNAFARGLPDGSLVSDTRLRDALAQLRIASAGDSDGRFALPENGVSRLALRSPDIVDDAAYAVECAAVGEVDVALLESHIEDLEGRIAWLEQRFWPRVLRRLSRIGRRTGP